MALTKVTGHVIKSDTNIISHNINSSGIITAVTFDGNVSGVAVTFTGDSTIGSLGITTNLTVGGNIDVDGHTDLDNVSIAGVTTFSDDVIFNGANFDITYDRSINTFNFDQSFLKFGTSGQLVFRSTGPFSTIDSTAGLIMTVSSLEVKQTSGDKMIKTYNNGAVELYHDDNLKFQTTNTGAVVSGILTVTGNMNVEGVLTYQDVTNIDSIGIITARSDILIPNDTAKLQIGASQDLRIYHDYSGGSENSHIYQTTNKHLLISAYTQFARVNGTWGVLNLGNSHNMLRATAGSDVKLYFNNTERITTTGYGATIAGITSATSFTASESGVSGQYKANEIKFDRNSYNYISCTDNSGQLVIRMGSSQVTAFAVDTSADTIFSNNRKIKMGSDKLQLYSDGTDGYVKETNGDLYLQSTADDIIIRAADNISIQAQGGEYCINGNGNGSVDLYYDGGTYTTPKLSTTATGITVDGEVAATQDYPNIRPVLDFNFAATKKLKPEMTFERVGEASFHDGVGSVKFVGDNEPRFEHDILTGECKGLMFEQAGTNYSWYSRFFKSSGYSAGSWVPQNGGATPTITENTHTAPDGTSDGYYMADTISGATGTAFNGNVVQQQHTAGANVKHTFSIYIKLLTATQATIYIRDGATGSVSSASAVNTRNWQRVVVTSTNALTNGVVHGFYIGNTNGTIAVWGSQIERSDYVTSYIRTTGGANGTRVADKGVRLDGEDVTDVFNQGEGTLIAEAILTQSVNQNPLVGFYQDFGTVNRIELRAQGSTAANARFESVVGSSSVVTNANSPHAGVNNVSKYAYAFQENNYASTVNGGTVQTDTNGAFPHGTGIDSMMIGEAVYNVDAALIVKRIMYYGDRLPNSQLVTLTS